MTHNKKLIKGNISDVIHMTELVDKDIKTNIFSMLKVRWKSKY